MLKIPVLIIFSVIFINHEALSAETQPFGFIQLQSTGLTQSEINQITSDTEQARIRNNGNPVGIAKDMKDTLGARYGIYWNCIVIYRPVFGSYWYEQYYIYMVSDTGDNMNVMCFKAGGRATNDNVSELDELVL